MDTLISIIVPVYNVQDYLEKCILSIINQTYKKLDIILVDDGSTDDSGIICDEYCKNDSRIRVIHQNNCGLSSARNAGIEIAYGDYIGFVDSDDYIDATMFEKLYFAAKKNNAQISICNYFLINTENIKTKYKNTIIHKEKVFNNTVAIEQMCRGNLFQFHAWNKLYKKELFIGTRFPLGKLFEDIFTTHKVMYKAEKVVVIPESLYFYVQRNGSILNSKFNIKKLDYIYACKDLIEFCKNNCPSAIKDAEASLVYAGMMLIREIYRSNSKDNNIADQIICEIKPYRKSFYFSKSNKHLLKHKLACVILFFNKKFFCALVR